MQSSIDCKRYPMPFGMKKSGLIQPAFSDNYFSLMYFQKSQISALSFIIDDRFPFSAEVVIDPLHGFDDN